ncbi:MAG: RNA polymerase sigma factor [bacterium]|nr:RNA polymerase sigma factor [bacterium]
MEYFNKNNEKTDIQLVSDYLDVDENALKILITRYLKPIYGFVFSIAKNTQDSEDIAQETFVKMWKNIKKYDKEQVFKTWLFTIAKNTTLDYLRKKKKKSFVFSDFEKIREEGVAYHAIIDQAPLPDEVSANREDKKFISGLLNQLATAYKEVLLLRYNGQYTFAEIGQILGKPLDTVKSQQRRALTVLRKILSGKNR